MGTVAFLSALAGAVLIGTSVATWARRRRAGDDMGSTGGGATVVAAGVAQAVGLYVLACGFAAQYARVASPLAGTSAPVIGDLAAGPLTVMVGALLLIGGTIGRSLTRGRARMRVL